MATTRAVKTTGSAGRRRTLSNSLRLFLSVDFHADDGHAASEGNTGNSFGCHLHFETYVNGYPVNPINFMRDRGVSV